MAKDIVFRMDGATGRTDLYALLTDGTNAINATTGASVALPGTWTNFVIPLLDPHGVAFYAANVPANTPRGIWTPICFQEVSIGFPAETDINIAAGDPISWDGLKVLTILSLLGSGDVALDENSGGSRNLTYQYMGVGIAGAVIRVYLHSDFNAGNYIVKGSTTTDINGEWVNPIWVNSGFTYTVTFSLPSLYQESSKVISI